MRGIQNNNVRDIFDENRFLAGVFFDFELPKEVKYLQKYFRTDLEKQFLRFYYCFGGFREIDYKRFTDYTGHFCQSRWVRILNNRHDKIVAMRATAKVNYDDTDDELALAYLTTIERGKLGLRKNKLWY